MKSFKISRIASLGIQCLIMCHDNRTFFPLLRILVEGLPHILAMGSDTIFHDYISRVDRIAQSRIRASSREDCRCKAMGLPLWIRSLLRKDPDTPSENTLPSQWFGSDQVP